MKKLKTKLFLFLSCFAITLHAQETVPASGGNATGTGGSTNYTIGQMVYTTNSGTNGSVAQGVQQPYEISVVTGINEAKGINLSVSVYPNPTAENLTLRVENIENSSFTFQLFDLSGKLLQNGKVGGNNTNIPMGNLLPATYLLKVIQNCKEVKTFKIIKN